MSSSAWAGVGGVVAAGHRGDVGLGLLLVVDDLDGAR